MNANELIDVVSKKCLENGFEALSESERVVWLISWADFEVNLGGATGYLYNSAGDHLPDLPGAFATIGCAELADTARKLSVALARFCDVRDRVQRQEAMEEHAEKEPIAGLMDDFTDRIQTASEGFGTRLLEFIRSSFPSVSG